MRRAAKTDQNQDQIVTALRAAGASVQSLAALGSGAPDLLVGYCADDWLMEVKHPERTACRRKPNTLQQEWHKRWRGKPVAVVLTPDEALRVIGAIA